MGATLPIGGKNKHCGPVPDARHTPSPLNPEPLSILLCYVVPFLPGTLVLICTELASDQSLALLLPSPTKLSNSHLLQAAAQATAGDAQLSLVQSLCGLLFTGNFHVYSCLPQKNDLWVDPRVSSVHSAPCKMPWWKPRGAANGWMANGWMAEAQIPGKPPCIFFPCLSWLTEGPAWVYSC